MREWLGEFWKPWHPVKRRASRWFPDTLDQLEQRLCLTVESTLIALDEAPHLVLGGTAVTWVKKDLAVVVLPQVTVSDNVSLDGSTLTISINAAGSKKKMVDLVHIPAFTALGSSLGPQWLNGQFSLQIEFGETATSGAVQSFLRGITFATKGKGLKSPTRTVNVTLDENGLSTSISQTIRVFRRAPAVDPGGDTIPFNELRDASGLNLPNEGYHALANAPDGTIARVIWQASDWAEGAPVVEAALYYGELQADGTWIDESIPLDQGAVSLQGYEAQLFFDSASVPHILMDGVYGLIHLWRDDADWEVEFVEFSLPGVENLRSDVGFTAAMGPDGKIHVAFAANGIMSESEPIVYGTNASGVWTFEVAFHSIALFYYGSQLEQTGTYPRFFQLAVDSHNYAHIVYTPEFRITPVPGGSSVFSKLTYATNHSGSWTTTIIDQPADGTGDSGLAASIAINPATDRPAIASFFVDRVATGSPVSGRLYYHVQQSDGSWMHQTVASTADRYVAEDGNQGTGFAPLLIFDGAGRANILFCDYASQHFPGYGADEFAGQLRHARLDGGGWKVQTVFRQADPIRNYLIHPAFAISGNRVTYLAIWRRDATSDHSAATDYSTRLLELTLSTMP